MSLTACSLADALQQWLDELVAQIQQEMEQAIQDWWQSLVDDVQQQITDWWEGTKADLAAAARDFWASLFPSAPVIVSPVDGSAAPANAIAVRGSGLANSTVTLLRDGRRYRDGTVNASGEWQMEGVVLNKGENVLTATVKRRLASSPASAPVKVTAPGGELGLVPAMVPAIDASLDPHAWMVELALELLKASGETFYEARRSAYTAALRQGMQASIDDDPAHRFINPDVPLSFDAYVMVLPALKDATNDQILESIAQAIESAVLDEGVRQQLMAQATDTFVRLDQTWMITDQAASYTFQYVRVDFDADFLIEHFDPRALAKFRTRLLTELITGLVGDLSGKAVEGLVKRGFALWGTADADKQAQHYFDLAIRAWNHRDIDSAPLRWDDPNNNGFDGDMGFDFESNEEWAMFYLGRALIYVQSSANPYYTIPYYKPEADLYAFLAGKTAEYSAKKIVEKPATAALGKVVAGGAGPVTLLLAADEIFDWMIHFARYEDAREVRDAHRPYFAEFVAGEHFEDPMPAGVIQLGSTTDRLGYPFDEPSDLMVHDFLENAPDSIEQRAANPSSEFDAQALLTEEEARVGANMGEVSTLVRSLGQHAAQYVHEGNFMQTDRRVPEGDMMYGNVYFIREVFGCVRSDNPQSDWWDAPVRSSLRLTLLDGTIVEGVVDHQPGRPTDENYADAQSYLAYVPIHVVGLNELSYQAGTMDSFPFSLATVFSIVGDERHAYVVFDAAAALPPEATSDIVPKLTTVLVGIAGTGDIGGGLMEKDGTAKIGADWLQSGAVATKAILNKFAEDTVSYQPPDPIIVGPGDLGVVLGSPADLHVYDRQGRHVGPTPGGGIALEIAGARYFTDSATSQQFIVISKADLREGYRAEVVGYATGTFDLEVIYPDRRESKTVRLAYDDVALSPETRATLELRAIDDHPLAVDDDGDGTTDQVLAPARTLQVRNLASSEPRSILFLAGVVAAVILVALLLWVATRQWRRRARSVPVPIVQSWQRCAHCGTPLSSGAQFCPGCGRPAVGAGAPAVVCARCGLTSQRAGARFCSRCGRPL